MILLNCCRLALRSFRNTQNRHTDGQTRNGRLPNIYNTLKKHNEKPKNGHLIDQHDDGITTKNAIFFILICIFTNAWRCNKRMPYLYKIDGSIEMSKNKRLHFTDSIRRHNLYLFGWLTSLKNVFFYLADLLNVGFIHWYRFVAFCCSSAAN